MFVDCKVYLPAIAGHVPPGMIHALSAFLEFCYLVRRSVINEETLEAISTAVDRFHHERTIFQTTGVRAHFSLPRQHAMVHYRELIELFGAPNGLCSSITESKHIRAVKEPWRRSNKFDALGQMLVTNQRLDKLAGARRHFTEHNILDGPLLPVGMEAIRLDLDDNEDGAVDDDPSTYVVKLASRPGMLLIILILVDRPCTFSVSCIWDGITRGRHFGFAKVARRNLTISLRPTVSICRYSW